MMSYSIDLKKLLYIILVYPFFKTYFFSEIGIMPYVNRILFAAVLIIIIVFYALKLPYIHLNSGLVFIIVYYLLIVFSSMLNDSINPDFFSLMAFSVGFALLTNYSLRSKRDFLYFLSAFYFLLYFYLIANLFSILIYPSGIPSITSHTEFPYYVFGNTNSVIKVVLPGLCFVFLYDLLRFKKVRKITWFLLFLTWITLIFTWSVTSIIGLFVFTFIVLNKVGKKSLFTQYVLFLLTSIGISIFLIMLNFESSILAKIVELFGKDLTFSNRSILWEKTVNSIKSSLFLGYGSLSPEAIWMYTGNSHGSHNYFLDTILRGGLTAIIFLLFGLIYFGQKIKYYKNNYVLRIILATSCSYFIMWTAEPFINTEYLMFTILFVLFSRIDTVLKYYYEE